MDDCTCPSPRLAVTAASWFNTDLGEELRDDELYFCGLDSNSFAVECRECSRAVTDLWVHQRVQAHLNVTQAAWSADLPTMPTTYVVDGVELPPLDLQGIR